MVLDLFPNKYSAFGKEELTQRLVSSPFAVREATGSNLETVREPHLCKITQADRVQISPESFSRSSWLWPTYPRLCQCGVEKRG